MAKSIVYVERLAYARARLCRLRSHTESLAEQPSFGNVCVLIQNYYLMKKETKLLPFLLHPIMTPTFASLIFFSFSFWGLVSFSSFGRLTVVV